MIRLLLPLVLIAAGVFPGRPQAPGLRGAGRIFVDAVAADRDPDEHVSLLRRRRAPLVEDDERPAVARQAQALEQARVRRDRVRAPDHHDLGPVADVAERGGARAAGLEREAGGAVEDGAGGVDRRADRVRQRDGGALRLARRLPQPVDERRARPPEDRRRLVERRVERDLAPVDAGRRRRRGGAVGEPGVAERARAVEALDPAARRDDRGDVVAHEAAAGAGRGVRAGGAGGVRRRHRPPRGRGARRAARPRGPRGR